MKFYVCMFLLAAILPAGTVSGHEPQSHTAETADMDNDGIVDSIWYSPADTMIMFRLSSRGFEPYGVEYLMENDGPERTFLTAHDGGFSITASHMRSWDDYKYDFDAASGRFLLVRYFHQNYGNAMHDGSGTMWLDLETGEFTGMWSYFNEATETLEELPAVTVHVDNPPVWFGDETDFAFPGYRLYEAYKEAYTPEITFTATFLGFIYDYDYSMLIGALPDGGEVCELVAYNYDQLYRGDVLELTLSTHCYLEPGNGEYDAQTMITDLEVKEAGPLRRFMETNSKDIDYQDHSQLAEFWEPRRLEAADYYLAVGGDKKVNKYLRKPGVLRIELDDYDGDLTGMANSTVRFAVGIFNDAGGKTQKLRDLIIEVDGEVGIRYWLPDKRGGAPVPLDIE